MASALQIPRLDRLVCKNIRSQALSWTVLLSLLTFASRTPAQTPETTLRNHYDAAEAFLSTNDREQAAFQFRLFLADALHRIAGDRSHIGEYASAVPLFEQALVFAPNDLALRYDFAAAAFAARDFAKANDLAVAALVRYPAGSKDPMCAQFHLLLGRTLLGMHDAAHAKEQIEQALRINPDFQAGYALAKTELALSQTKEASTAFAEMLAGFGDSAEIHMDFGRAYGEADFPEQAIVEFKLAIARDPTLPGVHYCLGAAYLLRSGDIGFADAESEFLKELAHHPDDYLSYAQLGYIAMSRHQLPEAERYLRRATELDPHNPDNFLRLGEIYDDQDKPTEAEAALRSAIAVTSDPSRNHYQIRGAHYQLGLILLRSHRSEEGKKELDASQQLLLQNKLLDTANLTGQPVAGYTFPRVTTFAPVDPAAESAEKEFERQIAPAIADSYDNLAVGAATAKDYATALADFAQTASWNPNIQDLDLNWGRSAFAAKDYAQAVRSLGRSFNSDPERDNVRRLLGFSLFMTGDYKTTITVLAPIAANLEGEPLFSYAYAESLIATGDYEHGVSRLQELAVSSPDLAVVHLALGKAFARHAEPVRAEQELRLALRLRPDDKEAEVLLARVLLTQQKR